MCAAPRAGAHLGLDGEKACRPCQVSRKPDMGETKLGDFFSGQGFEFDTPA